MADSPNYRFETANDHFFDMIERNSRWDFVDDRDDPAHIAEMVQDGDIEIDPAGRVIRMTEKGIDWAIWRSQDWEENRFQWKVSTMSVRRYAQHRRVPQSVVRAACEGPVAFAVHDGRIDYEVADALWLKNMDPKHD